MWQFNNPDFPVQPFITVHNECPLELAHMIVNTVAVFYDCEAQDDVQ